MLFSGEVHPSPTDPNGALKLNQKVNGKVLEVDTARKRIACSIKQTLEAPARNQRPNQRPNQFPKQQVQPQNKPQKNINKKKKAAKKKVKGGKATKRSHISWWLAHAHQKLIKIQWIQHFSQFLSMTSSSSSSLMAASSSSCSTPWTSYASSPPLLPQVPS